MTRSVVEVGNGEATRVIGVGVDPTETLARWAARFRFNRKLASAVQFTHNTLWSPAVEDLDRHTLETTTGLAIALNTALSLTLTVRDRYDGEAIARGAPSNHDGQLLFGIRAKYQGSRVGVGADAV